MTRDDVIKLQRHFGVKGTGNYGPITKAAVTTWQTKQGYPPTGLITDEEWDTLKKEIPQTEMERLLAAGYKFDTKADVIKAIVAEATYQGLPLKTHHAYIIATTDHETNHTFKPISEAYWLKNPDKYLKREHPDYYPYYGRGFTQLTWDYNYIKLGNVLGINLVDFPDRAKEPLIALFVMIYGFKHGAFTNHKLEDFINDKKCDFLRSRKCINRMDKAIEIKSLAEQYLNRL